MYFKVLIFATNFSKQFKVFRFLKPEIYFDLELIYLE